MKIKAKSQLNLLHQKLMESNVKRRIIHTTTQNIEKKYEFYFLVTYPEGFQSKYIVDTSPPVNVELNYVLGNTL